MAVHFKNIPATFIHIPRTAGNSFRHWVISNGIDSEVLPEKDYHATPNTACNTWPNLGTTFTFVRNPYARLVSLYHHIGQKALIQLNPTHPRRQELAEYNIKQLLLYKKGFEAWLTSTAKSVSWSCKSQIPWLDNIDIVIKTENLSQDFLLIQKLFDCYEELPHVNSSEHKPYQSYYNNHTKELVQTLCKDELDAFEYSF